MASRFGEQLYAGRVYPFTPGYRVDCSRLSVADGKASSDMIIGRENGEPESLLRFWLAVGLHLNRNRMCTSRHLRFSANCAFDRLERSREAMTL